MSEDKNDWNANFAERKAAADKAKAKKLVEAKEAAAGTEKEPFEQARFKKLYITLNPSDVDQYTAWESLLKEAEYDYYVRSPDKMTLKEYIQYQTWLDGWS